MVTSDLYSKKIILENPVSLTVIVVSLQVFINVNAGTADFKVDAELEKTFVFSHQLCQSHLRLDTKHLGPLSIKQTDTVTVPLTALPV